MPTLFLGKTLVFWSGAAVGVFFILNYATCFAMPWAKKRLCKNTVLSQCHKPLAWATLITGLIHTALAVLAYVYGIWL
jgi:hypothetical protein